MELITERLTLRPFREDDTEALYAYSKDEPVGRNAGWMMAKRGLELVGIHFFSYPYTSEHAKEKVLCLLYTSLATRPK